MFLVGILLMGLGFIYIWKPTVFRRGVWRKTSVAIRLLSEDGYAKYMKGLGAALVLIGLALALWSLFGDARSVG
jgi:hypothetical protein